MEGTGGRPSAAFVAASWAALLMGGTATLVGLWNAQMTWTERGFYLSLLLYGLFAAVSLQKSVRDRLEGIAVSNLYYGLCWVSLAAVLVLETSGLVNAHLSLSEKGFYGMAYALSLFAVVAVQKNVRDLAAAERVENDLMVAGSPAPAWGSQGPRTA